MHYTNEYIYAYIHKLIKNIWKGKVVDTFRSLYSKTHFRVKRNGKLSPPVLSTMCVNQIGISSGLMFQKYVSDLGTYLSAEVEMVISNEIITHVLWADDLILFSDSHMGLQNQLGGLLKFCSKYKITINETKTKVMRFGTNENFIVFFNKKTFEQVDQYKYLGVLCVRLTKRTKICSLIIIGLFLTSPRKLYSVWKRN